MSEENLIVDGKGKETDNGKKNEPRVVLEITMHPDGSSEMKSSLPPPMVIYLIEEMKFNILNEKNKKPTLFSPSGGLTRGLKRMFKR